MSHRLTAFAHRHPRWFFVLFCVALTAILWGGLESIFYGLLRIRIVHESPGVTAWEGGDLIEPDPYLGFRPRPGATAHMRLETSNAAIQECVYTIDAHGRRVTPVDHPERRDKFALFFGCSFTFGEGVNDDETLPAHFARAAPAFMPYNYAFKAYGPQAMYLQVVEDTFGDDIAQRNGIAVYVFIDHQMHRAIGTASVSTTWGRDLPYLTLEGGRLVHHGNFQTGRPFTQWCYRALLRLPSVQYLRIDYPPVDRARNYRLVATMTEESAAALRRRFPGLRFFVVIYPKQELGKRLWGYLADVDVTFLDYSGLLADAPGSEAMYYYLDGHPTGKTQRIVAEQLATDVVRTP